MSKWILIILCVFSFKTQAQTESSRIVRVLTFNILHGATLNNDFDLDKIAKVIIDANPDLVALQEVDFKTNRAKKYDLVTELAQRTGLVPIFGRAMYFDGGEYGEGILSKFSFVQTRNVTLPYDEGKEPRAALEVVVKINERDTIAFIGTHLDHTSSETRIPQVEKINEVFLQNNYPSILTGDLNDVPGSKPINILESKWGKYYNNDEYEITFPGTNQKLDYIMGYPKSRWRMLEQQVIKDKVASDHYALLIVLELLD